MSKRAPGFYWARPEGDQWTVVYCDACGRVWTIGRYLNLYVPEECFGPPALLIPPEVLRGLCNFVDCAQFENMHDRDPDSRAALEWLRVNAGWKSEEELEREWCERAWASHAESP